jgi:hypothetical protein
MAPLSRDVAGTAAARCGGGVIMRAQFARSKPSAARHHQPHHHRQEDGSGARAVRFALMSRTDSHVVVVVVVSHVTHVSHSSSMSDGGRLGLSNQQSLNPLQGIRTIKQFYNLKNEVDLQPESIFYLVNGVGCPGVAVVGFPQDCPSLLSEARR